MSSAVELMLKINKYSKRKFDSIVEEKQKDSNKLIDPKKFQVDMKYFTEWFAQSEEKNRQKFEYFYGPYTQENEDMLENLKKCKR